jgi:[acyl-carrier-protein] S-malonyltransferase
MHNEFRWLSHIPGTLFVFPGQGSQHVGMAKELADVYAVVRDTFAEADETLGFALSTLCFEGPEQTLTDTINAQPALLAASVAILRAVRQEFGEAVRDIVHSPANTFAAGHSMGEYSALVAVGSLRYGDALRLVRERGRLMKEAGEQTPGRMAAVLGLDEAQVEAICSEVAATGGIAQVANDNCPGQVVISGDHAGMEKAMAALSSAGAKKVIPLAVSIAAHSPLMRPAAEALRSAIEATPIAPPAIPLIANTNAQFLTDAHQVRAELVAQLTGSVRWTASMQQAVAAGVQNLVEIGPGEVLSGLMKRIERSVTRYTVNRPEVVKTIAQTLQAG